MKHKLLSVCLCLIMFVTPVSQQSGITLRAAEIPVPYQVVLEAENITGTSGSWNANPGTETDTQGASVGYVGNFNGNWYNAKYRALNFAYIGTFNVTFRIAATSWPSSGLQFSYVYGDGGTDVNGTSILVPQTITTALNDYTEVTLTGIKIDEAGSYDFKIMAQESSSTGMVHIDKLTFSCDNPGEPAGSEFDKNIPLSLTHGTEDLILSESDNLYGANGSLKAGSATGSYTDYYLDVKEAGNYTLTYLMKSNDAAIENAFQPYYALGKDPLETAFIALDKPMSMGRYYADIAMRQTVSLPQGEITLRIKANTAGFKLTKTAVGTVTEFTVGTMTGETVDPANVDLTGFYNATQSHAIEGGFTPTNLGYLIAGTGLDYKLNVVKGGLYKVEYNYAANNNTVITTYKEDNGIFSQIGSGSVANTKGNSGNWYDSSHYATSGDSVVMLPEGSYSIRMLPDKTDINMKTMKLTYESSLVDYLTTLLTNLKAAADITLADKTEVVKVRTAYDALTVDEKSQLTAMIVKLTQAEAKIAEIELVAAKETALGGLLKAYSQYISTEYKTENWDLLTQANTAGITAISSANSIEEVSTALTNAKQAMAAVEAKLKSILLTTGNIATLAESKAYRSQGSLNSDVEVGNYADYYVNVEKAGAYTISYVVRSGAAVKGAVEVKYEAAEKPAQVNGSYGKVDFPAIDTEDGHVYQIRQAVTLNAGEQTIRFVAGSKDILVSRIVIQAQKQETVEISKALEVKTINALDFSQATDNHGIIDNEAVTSTSTATSFDYTVSMANEKLYGITYNYTGAGKVTLSVVSADGKVSDVAVTTLSVIEEVYADSNEVTANLPKGNYTLRVSLEGTAAIKSFSLKVAAVKVPSNSLSLNTYKLTLDPGDSFVLEGIIAPIDTTDVLVWSTSNAAVATINPASGEVRAVAAGRATITATTTSGLKGYCYVTVSGQTSISNGTIGTPAPSAQPIKVSATSVKLNKKSVKLGVKETFALVSTVSPAKTTDTISYKSNKTSVATVSKTGVITAKKTGNAKITVTCGSKTASITVTVKKAPGKVKLNVSKKTLKVKKSFQIKVTLPSGTASQKITYSSSKTSVASVNTSGKVTAKKKGSAKITVKTFNNKKAVINIKVNK